MSGSSFMDFVPRFCLMVKLCKPLLILISVFAKLRRDELARPVDPAECGMQIWSARTRPRFGPTRHVASRESGNVLPHTKITPLELVWHPRNTV
jgi:hypothetical protein